MGWPSSVKIFLQLQDGVDYVIALHPNERGDEITAFETSYGPPGNTQAKNAAFCNLWRNIFQFLPKISFIDTDTIEIAPSCIRMFSGDNHVTKYNNSALQIKLSVDLDTGSEAADTWYDVFLIGDGSNSLYTAKFVLQGNTPAGATYYKKIFAVKNNVSSNLLKFFHWWSLVMWDIPMTITTTPSVSDWSAALSCAAAIPAISICGLFRISFRTSSANWEAGASIIPNGSTGIKPTSTTGDVVGGVDNGAAMASAAGNVWCMTDGSQQIQHMAAESSGGTVNNFKIEVKGYKLNL